MLLLSSKDGAITALKDVHDLHNPEAARKPGAMPKRDVYSVRNHVQPVSRSRKLAPLQVALPRKAKELPADLDLQGALGLIGAEKPELIMLFDQIENLQFWIKDVEGRFLWVSLPLLVNFGLQRRSQVIGLTDYDLADAPLASQFRADDEEVLKGIPIRSRVELVGRFNHTSLWHVTSKIPLHDSEGKIVGSAGVAMPYRQQDLRRPDSGMSNAIEFIIQHHAKPITNRRLAEACKVSLRVFHRRFTETYHTSPHEYVRQYRVRASCNALVFSAKSMAEIAQDFGFSDQSHYSREFRRLMNETPSAYRNRFKKGAAEGRRQLPN